MKKRISNILRSVSAVVLSVAMIAGTVSIPAKAANEEINYVSLGDSMANGYGFVGYNQNSNGANGYDFLAGEGVYGKGAYPLQFEDYLTGLGYTVNHTKLASSAMLAEDLLYLLDGREEFDDGWNGFKDYVGAASEAQLKEYFQESITDADIMTMGIGNASFGAFMLNKVTDALGVFGATYDDELNLEAALEVLELDAEQLELVMEIYDTLTEKLVEKVPAALVEQYGLADVVDIVTYTAAAYVVNNMLVMEKIVEMNPDVEIVLVGLLNTTYGMNITDAEGNVLVPFGDAMDFAFDALNAYMAGLPALKQAQGEWEEAKFYFAEQPNPQFICQVFDDLQAANWGDIQDGRLSGTIVRQRNIAAFNEALAPMIGYAVTGAPLVNITLEDVEAYEALDWSALQASVPAEYWSPWGAFVFSGYIADQQKAADTILSVAIYLAIEEAVAMSTDTMDIELSGLMNIAGDLSSVFTDLGTPPTDAPESTRTWLLAGLSTEKIQGMCKVYGLFKVGNGMSVHPTPEGHDEIAKSVIAAYANKYTAMDKTKENLLFVANTLLDLVEEYYDEAYAYAYDYAEKAGYIDAAVAELEAIRAELNTVAANAKFPEGTNPEFVAAFGKAVADANATITALEDLLVNVDLLDEESLEKVVALLGTLEQNLADVAELATIAGTDLSAAAWQQLVAAANAAVAKYEALKPIVIAQLKEAVVEGTEWLLEKANEAYNEFVQTVCALAKEYSPVVDAYLYDWFYNNPETVIGFFNEYGDEMGKFIAENYEAIFGVLGLLVVEFGDDVVEYVLANPEEALANFVEWYNTYGDRTLAMIKVYLDKTGVTDALSPEAIKAALATLNQWLADNMDAIADGIYEYADMMGYIDALENALNELKAEVEATVNGYVAGAKAQIEAAIAALEAQLEALEAQLKALEAELAAKYEELVNAAEDVKAQIEAAIAQIEKAIECVNNAIEEVKAAIAKLQAQLAEIDAMVKEVVNAVVELNAAVEELIAIIKGESEAAITEVVAQVKAALDKIADAVEFTKEVIDEINAAINTTVEFVEAVIEKVTALQNAIVEANEFLAEQAEAILAALEEAKAQLNAAVETAKAFAEQANACLLEKVNAVVEAYNAALLGATTADYTVTADSYYVSIGGSYANGTGLDEDLDETTFGYRVAEALGLDVDTQFAELARDGLRVEDLLYILDENFVADAYGKATIKDPAKLRDKYVAEIAKADLITVAAGSDNLTSFVSAQLEALLAGQPIAMDWARYVGAENVAYVQKALAKVNAEFVALGLGEYAPMLTKVVECYAYGYVGFSCNYAEAINAIHAINADALVVVVGMYNALDNLVLNIDGTEVAVGNYVNYFVELTDIQYTVYAMLTPNTIFVEVPETTTILDETYADGISAEAYIMALVSANSLLPSSTGHEYIKDQIIGALNVTVEEDDFLKGDVNDDGLVNGKDVVILRRYDAGLDVEYINLKAADINEDGVVNGKDVIKLRQFDAGIIDQL